MSPSHTLDFDLDACWPFVQSRLPGLARAEGMTCIGSRKDGELVAVVVYEGYNGHNVWMHVAAEEGARWMTKGYLFACFWYAFHSCGVRRLSGWVESKNAAAIRLDEHLGFREEARLRGAGARGSDVILYVMWRDDCRFLGERHG